MILVHSHLRTRPNTPLMSIYSRAAHGLGVGRLIISPVIVPRTSTGNFSAAAMPAIDFGSNSTTTQSILMLDHHVVRAHWQNDISGGFQHSNVIASPSLRAQSTLDVMKRSEHLGAVVGAAQL